MKQLLEFLERLEAANLHYVLGHYRESVNVQVAVPGERWEVEFFDDDTVEIEVFKSDGVLITGTDKLKELIDKYGQ